MIKNVVILGGGSSGLLAALGLKTHLPQLNVTLLHSSKLGVIGVGEGSLPDLPNHLHGFLGIDPTWFLKEARPTYKLGVKFLWGARDHFHYSFSNAIAQTIGGLPRPSGFYSFDDMTVTDAVTGLMAEAKTFPRQSNGAPDLRKWSGYHVENSTFVSVLEKVAKQRGVNFTEGMVADTTVSETGVEELILDSGEKMTADLFIDCSGFRSELLGKALSEPFHPYDDALFCDTALAGGWQRTTDEQIQPYTTAETMNSGWSWQIEHEDRVNRGYVYSSSFISDDEAESEFRDKNERVRETHKIRFKVGRYRNSWVKNVVALGNSAGFVEPLEATALFVICNCSRALVATLKDTDCVPTPTACEAYNSLSAMMWDEVRDFLAVHYRFNDRLETPFWKHCRNETALHGADPIVQSYRENGPTLAYQLTLLPPASSIFQLDGYYTLLLGQKVEHAKLGAVSEAEKKAWLEHQNACRQFARNGLTAREGMEIIRGPNWRWSKGFYTT